MHTNYLTFNEYQGYGGTLPLADFTLAEFKARKRIDYLTATRVAYMETIPEAVKLCEMVVIDLESKLSTEAQVENPIVSSFSTDGYSESYGAAQSMSGTNASKTINDRVRELLYGVYDDKGVPLLYRGVVDYV